MQPVEAARHNDRRGVFGRRGECSPGHPLRLRGKFLQRRDGAVMKDALHVVHPRAAGQDIHEMEITAMMRL